MAADLRRGLRKDRMMLVLAGLGLLGIVLEARLVQLQIVRHAAATRQVAVQSEEKIAIAPVRGAILDRHGRPLAIGRRQPSVFVDPRMARRADAGAIAAALGLPAAEVGAKLEKDNHFVWLQRGATEARWLELARQRLPGVGMVEESFRVYPQGRLAGSLIGRVGHDNQGLAGLEYAAQAELAGEGREMIARRDARGRLIDWQALKAGRDGRDLRLTLDEALQFRAEAELEAMIHKSGAKSGLVAVMVPQTGDLLAMASWPPYDPASGGIPHNAVAEMAYEPGSTFKAFTMIAALNDNKTHPGELIDCLNGQITVGGQVINDHKPFPVMSIEKVMAESSDVGIIKLGLRVGEKRFDDYMRAFGFGARTGAGLPGESAGIFAPPEKWSGRSLATLSMGQEIAVSPLQLLAAYGAIANGGRLLKPRIFADVPVTETRRLPVRPEVLARVRAMLAQVVDEGTGKKAALPGVLVAGKTGTAEKAFNGRYLEGRYVASFIGFFPVEAPVAVALVVIDEPRGLHYHGGDVAAPVFSALARDIWVRALAAAPVIPNLPILPTLTAPSPRVARNPAPLAAPDLNGGTA